MALPGELEEGENAYQLDAKINALLDGGRGSDALTGQLVTAPQSHGEDT